VIWKKDKSKNYKEKIKISKDTADEEDFVEDTARRMRINDKIQMKRNL
jgi:hypothetical protein